MQIEVTDVTKRIHGNLILDHVNFTWESGRIYGLQGPNGSGKTMLLRLIAGLIRPTSGKVTIDGKRLGKDLDFPESLGMLLEGPAFLPNYTGLQNLMLLASLQNKVGKDEVCKALQDVGLEPEDKRTYRKYSLGMKQRLGIAAAIMENPKLILLDEPTNALDHEGIDQITDLIRREKVRDALIVIASHDQHLLQQVADEIYAVNNGRIARRSCHEEA